MTRRTELFFKQVVLLIDMATIVAAFLVAYFLRQQLPALYLADGLTGPVLADLKDLPAYLWLLLVILPIWVAAFHMMGAYREMRVKSYREIIWILVKTNFLGLLFFGSVVFLLRLHYVSRSFMVVFFALNFLALLAERALLIHVWHIMSGRSYFHRRILIVGSGPRARSLVRTVQERTRAWGLDIVGILDPDEDLVGQEVEGVKVIGTLDELPVLLLDRVVDEVFFVVPRDWMSRIEEPILYCESVGVRATVAADFFNIHVAKAQLSDLDGMPIISFDSTPAGQWQLAIKRLCDIVVSALGLAILAPLFLAVAALVKVTSRGPVFFRQVRCGSNGRRFTMYKFRTMVADAEARKTELAHLNEMDGPVFKLANDPRLTAIGRWLRKTSIDELPQLINVLKGEMSLVGPRPPVPDEVEKYEAWQRRRLSMRPGITGYWQVNGRNHIKDFDAWTKLDLEYIDRWSLALDTKILLKTIPAVLFGVGAK